MTDPEVIRWKRIAELEREIAELNGMNITHARHQRRGHLRAELSRLRDEQPKGGDNRECTCHPDDNPPRPCPRKFAYSECVAAASPSPLPKPQDVRERFARALYFAAEGLGPESWYLPENDHHWERWKNEGQDGIAPSPLAIADVVISAFPTLAQSDAQPVGWQVRSKFSNDWYNWQREGEPCVDKEFYEVRPLYTAPPRLDASGLEGERLEQEGLEEEVAKAICSVRYGDSCDKPMPICEENSNGPPLWTAHVLQARAAIEAMHRSPDAPGLIEAAKIVKDWSRACSRDSEAHLLDNLERELRARAADRSAE